MIIVSNEKIIGRKEKIVTYDEFIQQAYGDGIEPDDYIINANDVPEEVYEDLKDLDFVSFFSLNGEVPEYFDPNGIEDWEEYSEANQREISSSSTKTTTKAETPKKENNQVKEETFDQEEIISSTSDKTEEPEIDQNISSLLDESLYDYDSNNGEKEAKVYVFGSSKGGTGKTFTSIMSTYRYAKTHPSQRIALVDFDIIDGQVGISIHKIKPTMRNYFTEYQKGYTDFETMHNFSINAREPYPQNVDFYLAPNNGTVIEDDDFWFNVMNNVISHYDVVVFDTGIDYLNIAPISYAYKIADKINLVTTTSIKSVNSVTKQIGKLKGEIKNEIFDAEDELNSRINIIITQMVKNDKTSRMNETIIKTLSSKANIIAIFGVISDSIVRAEFFGEWNVFDKNSVVNKIFDDIMA